MKMTIKKFVEVKNKMIATEREVEVESSLVAKILIEAGVEVPSESYPQIWTQVSFSPELSNKVFDHIVQPA